MLKTKRSNREHAHQHHCPSPNNQVIAAELEGLLTPALYAQQVYFRSIELRERVLNLPLILAAVVTMLWRQVASINQLTRMLAREDLLWCKIGLVS